MNEGHVHHATQTEYGDYPPSQSALKPWEDLVEYFHDYARQKPEVLAMWCFGIGFVLGWKLKPW